METRIATGKTCRIGILPCEGYAKEAEIAAAVKARGWRVAQIGEDYLVVPGHYVIRPIE